MTLFGIAALIGPVVGPTLGGWLVVNYDWRWIFYINVPVGLLALVSCYFLVEDPDYLKQERAELHRKPLNFDYIGLGLLALVMACWEIMLSKGQEWDWLGDPFWRVQTLLILFVLGLGFLIFREMRIDNPIVNFRVLGERNLAMSCIIIFCAFAVLYAASISLPALLQSLFGYDALAAGLVLSPAGISSISMLLVVGFLLGRGVDARWLIAAGLVVLAVSNYWMSQMNLEISPWQAVWPRMVLTAGLGLIFAPLNVAAFMYTPKHLRGAAVGLLALLRNEGGSVGTSWPRPSRNAASSSTRRAWANFSIPSTRRRIPSWSRPRRSSSSTPAIRPRRSRWPLQSAGRTCASSRRRRWPTSTSSGWRPSWGCCSCPWCC